MRLIYFIDKLKKLIGSCIKKIIKNHYRIKVESQFFSNLITIYNYCFFIKYNIEYLKSKIIRST